MHSTSIHLGFPYVSSHIFALDSAHHAVAILLQWMFYFGSISRAAHAKEGLARRHGALTPATQHNTRSAHKSPTARTYLIYLYTEPPKLLRKVVQDFSVPRHGVVSNVTARDVPLHGTMNFFKPLQKACDI
jgi:hypothetical protein